MGEFGDLLRGLLGTGVETFFANESIRGLEDAGSEALELAQTTADDISQRSQFTPFAVTTGAGSVGSTVDELGRMTGLNTSVSPDAQALMSQSFGDSLGLLGAAANPVDDRVNQFYQALGLGGQQARSEEDIFQMMESILQPQRDRDRLSLENRLFGQGRIGTRTSQFGGTPEQLAMEKAIEESRSGNLFNAFNLANRERLNRTQIGTQLFNTALGEQAQNANIGQQLLSTAFAPTEHLLDAYNTGLQGAQVGERSRIEGLLAGTGLLESGIASNLHADELASRARIERNRNLVDLLLGASSAQVADEEQTGLFDLIGGLFGGR